MWEEAIRVVSRPCGFSRFVDCFWRGRGEGLDGWMDGWMDGWIAAVVARAKMTLFHFSFPGSRSLILPGFRVQCVSWERQVETGQENKRNKRRKEKKGKKRKRRRENLGKGEIAQSLGASEREWLID